MGELVGRCRSIKPNMPATVLGDYLNDRIREIFDRKPQFSGTFRETDIFIPTPYNTGTISFTQNSTAVDGLTAAWDVSSVVNSSIPSGIIRTGYQIVTPASMSGISTDTALYCDDTGTPEVVSVIEVRPTSFVAIFNSFHNPGCTITTSTLSGRQLKIGNTYPIYTVRAVTSATRLIIDIPWKASVLSNSAYQILGMYYTIAPDIKMLVSCLDQAQGIPPLRVNVTAAELNRTDPQRSSTGYPQCLANRGPNDNGNNQWEIWPASPTERQLRVFYHTQPPKLTSEGDRIPYFLNPTVLFNGMMASAYSTKIGADDAYYDPKLAQMYEAKFAQGVDNLIMADEEHIQSLYSNNGLAFSFGGSTFWQSHDEGTFYGPF